MITAFMNNYRFIPLDTSKLFLALSSLALLLVKALIGAVVTIEVFSI